MKQAAQEMPPPEPAAPDAGAYRTTLLKIALRLAPILLLAYILNYTDRVNVSIAKLEMAHDLSFSNAAFGLGMGLYFIGYSVFDVPSTVSFHRTGARIGLARTMICWGVVTILTACVTDIHAFYVLRFLLGAAEAGFLPGVAAYLTLWFPARILGTVMSVMISGALISGIIVGPLSGFIMQSFLGSRLLHSWQWLFVLEGLPAVLLGVVAFFVLDDDPGRCRWLTPAEKAIVLEGKHRPRDEGTGWHAGGWTIAIRDPHVWLLGVTLLVLNLGIYSVVLCMPDLLASFGKRNLVGIGLLSAIPYVIGLAALPLVGICSDLLQERRWSVFVICVVGSVLFLLSILLRHDELVSFSCLSLSAALLMAATPLVWAFGASLHQGEASATSIATINMVSQLGGFVGPYVIGLAQDVFHNIMVAYALVTVVMLAGSVCVLLVPERRPDPSRGGMRTRLST